MFNSVAFFLEKKSYKGGGKSAAPNRRRRKQHQPQGRGRTTTSPYFLEKFKKCDLAFAHFFHLWCLLKTHIFGFCCILKLLIFHFCCIRTTEKEKSKKDKKRRPTDDRRHHACEFVEQPMRSKTSVLSSCAVHKHFHETSRHIP